MKLSPNILFFVFVIIVICFSNNLLAQQSSIAKGDAHLKFSPNEQLVEIACKFPVSQVANLKFKLNTSLQLNELRVSGQMFDFVRSGDTITPILTGIKAGMAEVELKYSGSASNCYRLIFNPEASNYGYTINSEDAGIFPQHISGKTLLKELTLTAEIKKPYTIISSNLPVKQWSANNSNFFKWQFTNFQIEKIIIAWGVFNEHRLNIQLADSSVNFPVHFFLEQQFVLTNEMDIHLRESAALIQSYDNLFGNLLLKNKKLIGIGINSAPLTLRENCGLFNVESLHAAGNIISGIWRLPHKQERFTNAFNRYLYELVVENARRLNLISYEKERFLYDEPGLSETEINALETDIKLLKSLHSLLGDSVFYATAKQFIVNLSENSDGFDLFKKCAYI
ncbi:MAG TPA: hypothetical protein DCQ31_19615, partial [Bacteroidales bacterium]|nr:hypothetical protein [Bacteroidales bacterium]